MRAVLVDFLEAEKCRGSVIRLTSLVVVEVVFVPPRDDFDPLSAENKIATVLGFLIEVVIGVEEFVVNLLPGHVHAIEGLIDFWFVSILDIDNDEIKFECVSWVFHDNFR